MRDLNEDIYKIRHTLISDDKYAQEVLQSKNRSYFIEKMLEVSQGNISSLNISGAEEGMKIIDDTFDNLTVFKESNSYFCSNVGCVFQKEHIKIIEKKHIENILKI